MAPRIGWGVGREEPGSVVGPAGCSASVPARGAPVVGWCRRESSDTLLGFEATRRLFPRLGGEAVVAPLWWWGVVFELWIVVASI